MSIYAYDPTPFTPEVIALINNQERNDGFAEVILSYATKSNGGKGKDDMWAIANVLWKSGISSFNGYMVEVGEDWQEEWYGNLPEAKVAILIMSPEYFHSKPCCEECTALVKLKGKVAPLPLQFGMPDMSGRFLGSGREQIKMGNLIKQRINNHLPPPDQGPFDKNFEHNAKILVAKVTQILRAKGIEPGAEAAHSSSTATPTPPKESRPSFSSPRKAAKEEPEQFEAKRKEQEEKEKERAEAKRKEQEEKEKERAEAKRKEQKEKERVEAERKEREQKEQEEKQKERAEVKRKEQEQKEKERVEAERKEREQREKERVKEAEKDINEPLEGTLFHGLSKPTMTQLLGLLPSPLKNPKLLFDKERDGATAAAFHEACDGKGPTLTLFQLRNGGIMGAFTSVSWQSVEKEVHFADDTAFICALLEKSALKFKRSNNPTESVTHTPRDAFGPSFGYCMYFHNSLNVSFQYLKNMEGCPFKLQGGGTPSKMEVWAVGGNSLFHGLSKPTTTQLLGLLPSPLKNSKLLFDKERDGATAAAFHAACDGKGPTLTLFQLRNGGIMGAFTSVSWQSVEKEVHFADDTAFICALLENSALKFKRSNKPAQSVTHAPRDGSNAYGPSFGFCMYFHNDLNVSFQNLKNMEGCPFKLQEGTPSKMEVWAVGG